jgi:hypothetical protein
MLNRIEAQCLVFQVDGAHITKESAMRLRIFQVTLVSIGLLLLLMSVQPTIAQDPATEAGSVECVGCHEGLRDYWDHSGHADAYADREFQEAWLEADNAPACLSCHTTGFDAETGDFAVAGVGCTTCHNPVPDNHPDNYIPTNISSRLCGTCHLETYSEWEDSQHSQEDLTCNQCHNPHTADIRYGSTQALCETCHEDEAQIFAQTSHAAEGMICTDCHLQVSGAVMGEGHGSRPHTFAVDMETCNSCHEHDMHTAGAMMTAVSDRSEPACYQTDSHLLPGNGAEAGAEQLSTTPPSSSRLAFLIPAGMALVIGLMINPMVSFVTQRRNRI